MSRDFTVAEQGKPHFAGHGSANSDALTASQSPLTPRAQGEFRRDGVFRIGDFFERITLFREAPAQNDVASWLSLQEDTLATAQTVRCSLIRWGCFPRLGRGSSSCRKMFDFLDFPPFGHDGSGGAIHLPRMLQRGDGAAAMLSFMSS